MNFIKTDHFSENGASKGEILLFIILTVMVLPFFVLAFFNHPSADDYCIASMIKNYSFWDYQKVMYNTWTGRYFANFTEALYTINFDLIIASRFIPFTLLCLLFLSIYLFVLAIFKSVISGFKIVLYALILFVVYLNIFPSTGEGIYWITGATEYLFANILALFFLTIQIKLNTIESTKSKVPFIALSVIIAFMAVGLNEITLCCILAISVLSIIYRIYFRQKFEYFNLIVLIFVLIFCYIDISAPGNYQRAGEFSQRFALLSALKISFISFSKMVGIHLQNSAFLLVSMAYLTLIIKTSKNISKLHNLLSINPIIVLICSTLFIFLLFFPATFTMGINPPLRVYSTIALFFILLWFLNITVLVNYYSVKQQNFNFSGNKILILLWSVIIISISTDFYKEPGKEINFKGNVFRATYDLFFNANKYNRQMNDRYLQISDVKKLPNKTIEFKELKNIPTTIFFVDISKEKNHWINSCYSHYYSLDSVVLKN